MTRLHSHLKATTDRLNHLENAPQEARWILADVFDLSVADLHLRRDEVMTDTNALKKLDAVVSKRERGVPLAYCLGKKPFRHHEYRIKKGVLIPRPETEELVDRVINELNNLIKEGRHPIILELGFGSGVITIELALSFPDLRILAWDPSECAYAIATQNAKHLGAEQVTFYNADFFDGKAMWRPIMAHHDVYLVSNPPYIPTQDWEALPSQVKDHEPRLALEAGDDGLNIFRKIIPYLDKYRVRNQFECGHDQRESLTALAKAHGLDAQIDTDLGGQTRFVSFVPALS